MRRKFVVARRAWVRFGLEISRPVVAATKTRRLRHRASAKQQIPQSLYLSRGKVFTFILWHVRIEQFSQQVARAMAGCVGFTFVVQRSILAAAPHNNSFERTATSCRRSIQALGVGTGSTARRWKSYSNALSSSCNHRALRFTSLGVDGLCNVWPLRLQWSRYVVFAWGSPPFSRTLTRRPIEAMRSVHVNAKEVQRGVQAWRG